MEYGSIGMDLRHRGYHRPHDHRPSSLVIVTIILIIISCLHTAGGQLEYEWIEGPWSRCEHQTCGYGGRQYRSMACVNSNSRRVDHIKCDPRIRPAGGRLCYKPCVENPSGDIRVTSDDIYNRRGESMGVSYAPESMDNAGDSPLTSQTSDVEWVVSPWSDCRLLPGSTSCGRHSGVKTRNVTCGFKIQERRKTYRRGRVSSSRCEEQEDTPVSSQSCELLCKQNCVVTEYSAWSECDPSCQVTNKTRTRQVVVPPFHQGAHCPALSEMETCDACTNSYTYRFHEWSDCTPLQQDKVRSHPLIGYQTRELSCLENKGVITLDSHCHNKHPQTPLVRHRPCVMPMDCEVSSWSSFRPYNTSCRHRDGHIDNGYMYRTRQVIKLPLGDGRPCPASLVEYVRIKNNKQDVMRSCKRAKWVTSSFSECQPVPGYNNCLTGVQSRRAVCLEPAEDGIERPVGNERCPQPMPILEQSCTLDCDWDCTVSQWSAWSVCTAGSCGGNRIRRGRTKRVEQVTGKKYRTRKALTLPGPNGRQCPHLTETQMCIPEPCFRLNRTKGPCEATTIGSCGNGTRSMEETCLDRTWKKVSERYCTGEMKDYMRNWEECYVPCPNDCVLSEWTEWSPCPDPCQVQPGDTVLRSKRRKILAYHSPGQTNYVCPGPQNLLETETCPSLEDCNVYRWEISAWSPCTLDRQNSMDKCGWGKRTRTVKCESKVKPPEVTNCTVFCPVDCRFTPWSEWSSCGMDCLPIQARHIYPKRNRHRYILEYPSNEGGICPTDLEESDDCYDLPVCETFHWNMTDWSECILPPIYPICGQGIRARNISCFSSTVQGTNPMPINACLDNLGTMPVSTETCYAPCEAECEFTQWSSWTQCGSSCEGSRFRYRRPSNYSKQTPNCRNTEYYPLDEHQECECHEMKSRLIGQWSDCIIQSEKDPHSFATMSFQSLQIRLSNMTAGDGTEHAYCGKGKKYKVISCHKKLPDKNGIMRCVGSGYEENNCELPCPTDCKMTQWTSWSQCAINGVDCGSGFQQRERNVATYPSNGGRKCPFDHDQDTDIQTRVCHIECHNKIWRTQLWGPCIPDHGQPCGQGKQTRAVSCESVSKDGASSVVDAGYCMHEMEPSTIKSCSLPCPGECVMTEWSDWTQCEQPCNGQQLQTRHRDVLRNPARHASQFQCQPKKEERLCERLKNCVEYKWELSMWTSCLVSGGGGECGIGYQKRYARCRNEIGERVDDYLCQKYIGSVTEPLEYSCQVPCDNDCLMSSWSEWSPCTKECGLGVSIRSRSELQSPVGNGRKCPEKRVQNKPCYHKGCYHWQVTEWSSCISHFGSCGSGVQERNVSCVGENGRVVNSSMCALDPEKLVMQTTHNCHVPCPGECKLSGWSPWSECFVSCEDLRQGFTSGVRARSRSILAMPVAGNAPCNQTLWYREPCRTTNCSEFAWKHESWQGKSNKRSVWCQRNDGLKVHGGCALSRRPPSWLECKPYTCIEPAFCRDTNTCECRDEDHVVHTLNSSAITCIMNDSAIVGDASTGDKAEVAAEPNVWMYAVIAVCTVFVIAVTAALYNMCELFRSGPRPRRKGETGSTTGTMNSAVSVRVAVDKMGASASGTATPVSGRFREENLYKQLNSSFTPSSHPSTQPSPCPSPHCPHRNDIPDARFVTQDGYSSNTNTMNSAAAVNSSMMTAASTGLATSSSCNNFTPVPPSSDMTAHNNSFSSNNHMINSSGSGIEIDPSHGGHGGGGSAIYVNSVRNVNNSTSATNNINTTTTNNNACMHSSSVLPRDSNRRYKRVHCLLPHRLALCFSCGKKSSVCMVDDGESSSVHTMHEGHGLEPMASSNQVQAMSLTRAHAIENMELCGGEFYTKTTCGFQDHQCMLPPPCEHRPNNLDLQTTFFNDCVSNPCQDEDNHVGDSPGNFEPSLAAELQEEISRISPDTAQDLKTATLNKVNASSSESIALSTSELVSAKLEESSQCSLQLGDTAETYVSQKYPPPPPPPPPPYLHLSTGEGGGGGGVGRTNNMRQQLLQNHQRSQQQLSSSPQLSQHSQGRRSPNKRRRQYSSPPSPSPPPLRNEQRHNISKSMSLPLGYSSSKLVRDGHGHKLPRNNKLTHANTLSNPVLGQYPDFGGGRKYTPSDCSSVTNHTHYSSPSSLYAPLHVNVRPLSPNQVEAMLGGSDVPSPSPPIWQGGSPSLNTNHPLHPQRRQHRPHQHHGKPSSTSSLSTHSTPYPPPPEIPLRSYHPSNYNNHSQHPNNYNNSSPYTPPKHSHHHNNHTPPNHRRPTQPFAPASSSSIVGDSPPYSSPRSPSTSMPMTPGSTARSFMSLPERATSPLCHNQIEKTSEDSGHSTMSRSRTVSPGDFPGDLSQSSPRGGNQTSEESAMCTSCQKDVDRSTGPVPGLYLTGTPDFPSQASNLSGMETSV